MSSQLGAVDDEIEERVRDLRQSDADLEAAALNTETRKVRTNGSSSVGCNLTTYGRKTLDLTVGDTVTVATFADCLVIVPAREEDEGDE